MVHGRLCWVRRQNSVAWGSAVLMSACSEDVNGNQVMTYVVYAGLGFPCKAWVGVAHPLSACDGVSSTAAAQSPMLGLRF